MLFVGGVTWLEDLAHPIEDLAHPTEDLAHPNYVLFRKGMSKIPGADSAGGFFPYVPGRSGLRAGWGGVIIQYFRPRV